MYFLKDEGSSAVGAVNMNSRRTFEKVLGFQLFKFGAQICEIIRA